MNVVVVTGTLCTETSVDRFAGALAAAINLPVQIRPSDGNGLGAAADAALEPYERGAGHHVRGEPTVLVGHSLGGIVSLAASRRRPERVAGLVLIATNPRAPRSEQLRAWTRQEELVSLAGPRAVVEELLPLWLGPDDSTPTWSARAELCRRMAVENGGDRFRRQLKIQRERIDERPGLAGCPAPVLAVSGAHDRLVSPDEMDAIATAAPVATRVTVDGAGHLLPLEVPQKLADCVATWYRETVLQPNPGLHTAS